MEENRREDVHLENGRETHLSESTREEPRLQQPLRMGGHVENEHEVVERWLREESNHGDDDHARTEDREDEGQEVALVTDQCAPDMPRARSAEIETLLIDQGRPTDQGSQSRLIDLGRPIRLTDQGRQSRLTDQDRPGRSRSAKIMPTDQDRPGRLTDQGSQSRLTNQEGRLIDQDNQIMPTDHDSLGMLTDLEPSYTNARHANQPVAERSGLAQDQLKA
ncbi:hypothetical protein CJ030_MR7G022902 [Morella rubra]|uniref:Uncharacterized protein n=1 Tax=Morella rubra TaxID=262757 RepID=A0A6A1V8U6_9ROSI|nr:hypothetical protein CJ030_MR7G022902 [Morella rubra]